MTDQATAAATADYELTPGFGLFRVAYKNKVIPGGVGVALELTVSTPERHISGLLHLTQATNPPLNLRSRVSGNYIDGPQPIEPPPIIATLMGYPVVDWPPHGGIGPVLLPNAKVTLYIEPGWQSATANVSYLVDGTWKHVNDVKLSKFGS